MCPHQRTPSTRSGCSFQPGSERLRGSRGPPGFVPDTFGVSASGLEMFIISFIKVGNWLWDSTLDS